MATTIPHRLPTAQQQAIADLTGYEDAATLRWQQACVQAANQLTALPNGRYVQVRMERMRHGLELAQRGAVSLPDDGQDLSAVVRSGTNLYQVDTRLLTCACADYQKHFQACKHLLAVEIHLGALGLVPPDAQSLRQRRRPLRRSPPPIVAPEPRTGCPTAAQWPTSEAPASMNVQLKVGSMQLMYTARDTNDRDLQDRMTQLLPWLAEVMAACEANYDARQKAAKPAAEPPKPTPAQRRRDAPIAAAIAAALTAQANGTPPPRDPPLAPTHDTDPSWCPLHRCAMPRRTNARGSWYSHRLHTGDYCKGE